MFDENGRCFDSNCDGHYRHFQGCEFYEGEPLLSVQDRVAIYAMVAS